jgi:type VI secretion system protein VasI
MSSLAKTITKFCAVIAGAMIPAAVKAQEACFTIGHPIERLECYDQWASEKSGEPVGTVKVKETASSKESDISVDTKQPGAEPPSGTSTQSELTTTADSTAQSGELKPEQANATKWRIEREKSAMSDTYNVFASLSTSEQVSCRQYGAPSTMTLWLRCMENTTSVIVSGNCHLASGFYDYGKVTYRLDDTKAKTRSFEASTDNSALGLWNGGEAIPFIKDMFDKEKLLVRLTPFGMNPVEVSFDIAGTEDAVKDLRAACSW